jgi:biopolymer transport protein ExbD
VYKKPSRKKKKHEIKKPNLIPILDAVFIFIFFLLMSANFRSVFEINSDVPMVSAAEPPVKDKKPPLALTLEIQRSQIKIYTGVPSVMRKSFSKADGKYDLVSLRNFLIELKKNNSKESSIIFEPKINLEYQEIVRIMDSVRALKKTEPAIFRRDKDGSDVRVKTLFDNIIFGNIQS